MPKILIDILVFSGLLLAGLFAIVRYLEKAGVFFPSRRMAVNPAMMGLVYEDIYFKTKDGLSINGWLCKHPKSQSTLIFAHGNAGNMSDRLFKIKFFHDLGLNVFIFDYRGYGNSDGVPSEEGIYLDGQAAYDYLQARPDINMEKVIMYGASLGGTVAVDLATQRQVALLVVESSVTNAHDMAHVLYPFVPLFFLSLKFDNIHKVRSLTMPKLFIHSPEDEVVPYWLGEKLFEAACEPKEFLKIHGGHNDGSITVDPHAAKEFTRILKSRELL